MCEFPLQCSLCGGAHDLYLVVPSELFLVLWVFFIKLAHDGYSLWDLLWVRGSATEPQNYWLADFWGQTAAFNAVTLSDSGVFYNMATMIHSCTPPPCIQHLTCATRTETSCSCLCSTWDHTQFGQGLLLNPSLLLVLSPRRFSAWWSMQLTSQGVFYENCSLWKILSGISRRKHLKQSKSSVCVLLFGRFQKRNWLGEKKKKKGKKRVFFFYCESFTFLIIVLLHWIIWLIP